MSLRKLALAFVLCVSAVAPARSQQAWQELIVAKEGFAIQFPGPPPSPEERLGDTQNGLDAVRQWVYEPTSVGGKLVPVIMTVTVNFKLTP